MIHLNAGNLWTDYYLDKVIELNKQHEKDGIQVKSLFGSIARLTPTARSADRLPYLEWSQIDHYVARAKKNGIKIRYTLNASCLGSLQDFKHVWETKLKDDVKELHNIGIDEWTITSPLLMQELREMFPDDFLEVSTIAEVDSPTTAQYWYDIGARGVNLSTNINRNFGAIREIVQVGLEVSILANEACLFHCPFRRDCYNLSSHNSLRGDELFGFYPFGYCNNMRMEDLSLWIKSRMVLPQWMTKYQEYGVNWFKIAYRTHPYETAIPILELYMNKYHGGNYLDLWPTISHLGGTEEPKDMQFISCEGLDDLKFFDRFLYHQSLDCSTENCGQTCVFCDNVLQRLTEKGLAHDVKR
jgi:hypothetical protein